MKRANHQPLMSLIVSLQVGIISAVRRRSGLQVAVLLAAFVMLASREVRADDVTVAVATNFAGTVASLSQAFKRETGHKLIITTGATGQLYAQIQNGAPFDVLLSADAATPERLEAEGLAVSGSRFTYAVGRLALWSQDAQRMSADGQIDLAAGGFRHIAIANPDVAPYGAAAREVLRNLKLWNTLQPKLVMGQNIGQTHALVATGNAELGFVAMSTVAAMAPEKRGSVWLVPQQLYAPIRQDAVLLKRAADNAGAKAFLAFLRQATARRMIEQSGYALEN